MRTSLDSGGYVCPFGSTDTFPTSGPIRRMNGPEQEAGGDGDKTPASSMPPSRSVSVERDGRVADLLFAFRVQHRYFGDAAWNLFSCLKIARDKLPEWAEDIRAGDGRKLRGFERAALTCGGWGRGRRSVPPPSRQPRRWTRRLRR